jgi:hypothetical protein
MANHVLLGSALLSSIVHLIFMGLYTPPVLYGTFLGSGLITSILNHGFTSDILKWMDRAIMLLGTGITLYLAPTLLFKILIIVCGALYYLAKILDSNYLHIGAHATITTINVSILIILYKMSHRT